MKILAFVPGVVCMVWAGYLCYLENNNFGWFLGLGFMLSLCALGILIGDENNE